MHRASPRTRCAPARRAIVVRRAARRLAGVAAIACVGLACTGLIALCGAGAVRRVGQD